MANRKPSPNSITDFDVCYEGKINADQFGNNVAFACPRCNHPVLAINRKNWRGNKKSNPAMCRQCKRCYVIEVCKRSKTVTVKEV